MLGSLAVGLTFLWAIDANKADAFSFTIVQDFDGVAVDDGDDLSDELRCDRMGAKQN